MATRLV